LFTPAMSLLIVSCNTLLSPTASSLPTCACRSPTPSPTFPTPGSSRSFVNQPSGAPLPTHCSPSVPGPAAQYGETEYVPSSISTDCTFLTPCPQMFLRFQGPANILVQSRGAKLTDAFTARDVNEAADTPAGVLQAGKPATPAITDAPPSTPVTPTKLSYATVENDGKVTITKS
jgi:hypothetical protein